MPSNSNRPHRRRNLRAIAAHIVLLCLVLAPSVAAARNIALGLNIGLDDPSGDSNLGPGGIWHLAAAYVPSSKLSLALELGTAVNCLPEDRTVTVAGVTRLVETHAVSTLGLIARRQLGEGRFRPQVVLGADYFYSWDDLRTTPTISGTVGRSGMAIQFGTGATLRLGGRWDIYGDGLYHFATDRDDDARFAVVQGGLWFYLGRREPLP